MARIEFRTFAAAVVFSSMAEGMWENRRDDNEENTPEAQSMWRVAEAVMQTAILPHARDDHEENHGERDTFVPHPPIVVPIEERDAATAQDILDNCLDVASGREPGDVGDEDGIDFLFPGDAVIITDAGVALGEAESVPVVTNDMPLADALDYAISVLALHGGKAAASPLWWLRAIRDQRGCESVAPGEGCDTLVELIETIVVG